MNIEWMNPPERGGAEIVVSARDNPNRKITRCGVTAKCALHGMWRKTVV